MKKKIFVLLFILFLFPLAVNAETNLKEVHDNISVNNDLTIKSIPFEKYKESKYFEACTNDTGYDGYGTEESCSNTIYRYIVTSHINKNVRLPEDTSLFADCDYINNVCEIEIHTENDTLTERYNINFIEVEENNIYNIAKNSMNSLKKKYELDDMGYINQLINYEEIERYYTKLQSSAEIFKIYPEIKDNIEKNPIIKYLSVFGAGGYSPLTLGSGGVVVAYYNDIAVGISDQFYYSTYRIIYIPNTTENTKEAYIEAALRRVTEYINDDNYEVSIQLDEELNKKYCGEALCEYAGFKTNLYKITINDKSYNLGIVPIEENEIKKLKVKSKDYLNDISVETNSSDVPLDSSITSEDVTDKYKEHGYKKAYDINLYSDMNSKYITKIKNGIVVMIPIDDIDDEYINVYHIKDDGKQGEKYQAKVEEIDGKKYAVFTTNHFSTYAVGNVKEEVNPETSDSILSNILYIILGVISITAICILRKQKLI